MDISEKSHTFKMWSSFGSITNTRGSSVALYGRRATINGVTYDLPPYRSCSINNGTIFLDGKRWDPATKRLKRSSELVSKTFTADWETGDRLAVNGVTEVIVTRGDEFKCTLEMKDEQDVLDAVVFEQSRISIPQSDESSVLKIVLPDSCEMKELALSDIVATIKVSDIQLPGLSLDVKDGYTTSTIQDVYVDKIGIWCGNVRLKNVRATEEIYTETVSTPISIENVTTESLDVHTVSGSVCLIGKCTGKLFVRTVSGGVQMESFHGKGGSVKTVSGSVYLSQHKTEEIKKMDVKTVSGSLRGSGKVRVSFKTVSGRNGYDQI